MMTDEKKARQKLMSAYYRSTFRGKRRIKAARRKKQKIDNEFKFLVNGAQLLTSLEDQT